MGFTASSLGDLRDEGFEGDDYREDYQDYNYTYYPAHTRIMEWNVDRMMERNERRIKELREQQAIVRRLLDSIRANSCTRTVADDGAEKDDEK